jgi:hypothetical protein
MGKLWLFMFALAAPVLVPAHTQACKIDITCPGAHTLPADGESQPRNLRGFLWRPTCDTVEAADFAPELWARLPTGGLERVEIRVEQAQLPDSTTFQYSSQLRYVHWEREFPGETELSFEVAYKQSFKKFQSAFEVSAQQPIPEALPRLAPTIATGMFMLTSNDGDCAHLVQASFVDVGHRIRMVGYLPDGTARSSKRDRGRLHLPPTAAGSQARHLRSLRQRERRGPSSSIQP